MPGIPSPPQPRVSLFRVQVGRRRQCGKTVRGEHPDVAPDRYGATAHRLGPRVKALAHSPHYVSALRAMECRCAGCWRRCARRQGLRSRQAPSRKDAMKPAEGAIGKADRRILRRKPYISVHGSAQIVRKSPLPAHLK